MMSRIEALTGNNTVAEAMRQINPDVVAAYPITPQTELMEEFAQFVADGLVDTEYMPVESEHSALSACIGASLAGARVMTATSACGFALMWELLPVAAGMRTPIIMSVVNRAFNAPLNIHCSHDDTMGGRDSGWIQFYSENAQELYDNLIQAVRIAEDGEVLLPAMVAFDGFIISHAVERVELLEDEDVRRFIGQFRPIHHVLDPDHPVTFGACALQDYYMEHKWQHSQALKNSIEKILEIAKEYEKISGRRYGLFEAYELDDAQIGIVVLNSASGVVRSVVKELRKEGIKAGMLKLRVYRPFPSLQIKELLKGLKAIAVLERTDAFGASGSPTFLEIRSVLAELQNPPPVTNYIYGLGGRDFRLQDAREVYKDLLEIAKSGKPKKQFDYINVRK
jgi:pyruvate ferredoxin oxidoreductase alpha subunit